MIAGPGLAAGSWRPAARRKKEFSAGLETPEAWRLEMGASFPKVFFMDHLRTIVVWPRAGKETIF